MSHSSWKTSSRRSAGSVELIIRREPTNVSGTTFGTLYIDGVKRFLTLEDAIREVPDAPVEQWKIKGSTAIPAGRYRVILDMSARFKYIMPHVLGVPGFTGIRIHAGNTTADTEGCPLVGRTRAGNMLTLSRPAFRELMEYLTAALSKKGGEVYLTVENPSYADAPSPVKDTAPRS